MKILEKLIRTIYTVFFLGAFVLAGLAIWEKFLNLFGFTLLRTYSPRRFLELSLLMLIFVISMQLQEIVNLLNTKSSDQIEH